MLSNIHVRKVVGDISSRKLRTFLVCSSIFIGVLGVIILLTVRDLIIRQLENDVKVSELSMIEVDVTLSSSDVDNDRVLALLNNETEDNFAPLQSMERVEGVGLYPVDYRRDSEEFIEGELRIYPIPLQDSRVEPMRLIEGDWPTIGQQELALEIRLAQIHDYDVGDTITLQIAETQQEFTVSALVFHPYSYKRPANDGAITPGPEDGIYINFADARQIFGLDGLTRFLVRYETFSDAEANFEGFQTILRDETPYLPKFPIIEAPEDNGQIFNAETFGNILSILAIVGMLVSSFLVVNVINTIIAEQKRQIGVMKSLGATRLDNFIIFSGIALGYGLIGTLAALVPGIVLGYSLAQTLAPQLDIYIEGFNWSPLAVLIAAAMGIFIPVLAAMIPVWNGTRVTILEAVTDLGIDTSYDGTGPIASTLTRLPLPLTVRQATINLLQKKGRLALTGLTLTFAIGASMGTIAMGRSLSNGVDDIFSRIDYQITILPGSIDQNEETQRVLEAMDMVSNVSPGVILTVQIDADYENFFTRTDQVIVFGNDPEQEPYQFSLDDGDGWSDDPQREGLVLATPLARQIDVGVGDDVAFFVSGERFTREVIGLESSAYDGIWMRWDDLATLGNIFTDGPQPNIFNTLATIEGVSGFAGALGIDSNGSNLLTGNVMPANAVFISEALASSGDYSIEDTITMTINGTSVERTVTEIISQADFEALAEAQGQSVPVENIVFFNFTDLVEVSGTPLGDTPAPNGFYVAIVDNDFDIDKTDIALEQIEAELAAAGINATARNEVVRFNEITSLISQYTAILTLSAILITAVGAVGLLTTLTIAVIERQKEIGVMRSIGASSYTIATQFLTEGLIVGTLAWVAGIPISYVLALQIQAAFRLESVTFRYPPEVLFGGLGVMLLIAAIASMGPALGAARRTVSSILRYQ